MAGLSDDQLKAIVDQELRASIGFGVGKLAGQRQKALVYYEGIAESDLAPPEIEGRSTVVSTDVRNVIQSVLPVLMAKFSSGEDIVEAVAKRSDKEASAKQVTDYLNYVFYSQCNGHQILETAFLDTLISKVGVIKVWWDTRTEETKETYKALDDVELSQIADDEEVEIVSHTAYEDEEDAEQRKQAVEQLTQQLQSAQQSMETNPQAGQAAQQIQQQLAQIEQTPPKMLHDIDVKRVKEGGKINLVNVPPEEFRISRKARTIADAPMVGHSVRRTISELKSMGYKNVDEISSDPNAQMYSSEAITRQSYDDEQPYFQDDQSSIDDSMRVVWVNEVYLRADRDGDGIAELLKITKAGNTLLDVEEVDIAPFIDMHAITHPYRFFGMSLADMAMEPQRIKTNILRAVLDNLMLQVNGRYFAVEGQVNLDDLLNSRPGGVVRTKQPGAVGRLDQAAGDGGDAMGMLQYLQGFTEESTGWQRMANAVDDIDSLNTTATAANIQSNRQQMRVDLMARNLAEGVVKLFRQMLKLVCQHQDKVQECRINGKWESIDPREWANAYDFCINVGLGSGSKEQQVQQLNLLAQHQMNGMQIGIATPANIYASAKKMTEAMGYRNADAYWNDPGQNPPPAPPPDPELMKIQAMSQSRQQEMQMQLQIEQQKMQIETQADAQRFAAEAKMNADTAQAQQQAQTQDAYMQAQIDAQQKDADRNLQLTIAQMQIEKDIKLKLMDIESKQNIAATAAQPQADANAGMAEMINQLATILTSPKAVVRDTSGRIVGVQHVKAEQ